MVYLARKFSRSKWQPDNQNPGSLSNLGADAITSCLRTSGNTLSVWEAASPVWGEFDDVLAALFSTLDAPAKLDVILLNSDSVSEVDGVELIHNLGKTPADEVTNRKHVDISKLNLSSLTAIADIILTELEHGNGGLVKRYTQKETLGIVQRSIERNQIDTSQLSERWRIKLGLPVLDA